MTNPTIHLRNSARLRKGIPDKEMKEYAESAMNELLGWYGYDKMNSGDSHATSLPIPQSSLKRNSAKFGASRSSSAPYSTLFSSSSSFLSSSSSSLSSSDDGAEVDINDASASNQTNDSFSTIPSSTRESSGSSGCGWCHKTNNEGENFTIKMINSDKLFCSEICFTHYRRANFRRNKTCDWCRHVRHTVNYVNLRDGDNRYQFCSNKCLNQFKLDIFCQETKEHLEMHPHHREQLSAVENNSSVVLITPDLWLKNCVSPRNSDKSRSSSPTGTTSSVSLPGDFRTSSRRKSTRASISPYKELPANVEDMVAECFSSSTRKKRAPKSHSLATPSPKPNSNNNLLKSATPKISFKPNFSSMLPSSSVATAFIDYTGSPHTSGFQSLSTTSTHDHDCSITTPLPVPPLLPITKSQPAVGCSSSSALPVSSQPTCTSTASTTSSISSPLTTANSLLPPPTVLIPYPIILPIPLPIPIPIPLPISVPIPFDPIGSSGDNCSRYGSNGIKNEQKSNTDLDSNDKPNTTGNDNSDSSSKRDRSGNGDCGFSDNCISHANNNDNGAGNDNYSDSTGPIVTSKRSRNGECKITEIRSHSPPAPSICIEEMGKKKRRKIKK